jgi:hypothetical protein
MTLIDLWDQKQSKGWLTKLLFSAGFIEFASNGFSGHMLFSNTNHIHTSVPGWCCQSDTGNLTCIDNKCDGHTTYWLELQLNQCTYGKTLCFLCIPLPSAAAWSRQWALAPFPVAGVEIECVPWLRGSRISPQNYCWSKVHLLGLVQLHGNISELGEADARFQVTTGFSAFRSSGAWVRFQAKDIPHIASEYRDHGSPLIGLY